jgi:hypothetical protein
MVLGGMEILIVAVVGLFSIALPAVVIILLFMIFQKLQRIDEKLK